VRVEGGAFTDERARLIESMDQPSTDGVNSYFVARAAARAGLKVAISGLGGDELFGGYATFDQVPRLAGALGWVPGARSLGRAFRVVAAPLLGRLTSPKYAGLFEYGTSEADAYLLRRALFMPWELPAVLDPDLAAEGWRALAPRLRIAAADALATPRARITAYESVIYMRNQLLRDADWAGMAHSLEVRVPLVDTTLLARLAPMLAAARPPTKRDMAGTPSRPLPAAVIDRPKTGFAVPIRDWLGGNSAERGLRGWAREIYAEF
jgi:asparagine synthase (glutamine-hydrolysing)